MRLSSACAIFLLSVPQWLAVPQGLAAQTEARPAADAPKTEGRLKWSLAAGYGFTVQLNRGRSEEQLVLVAPAVAYALSRRFELVAEGHLSGYFTPEGYMLGIVPFGLRYHFSDAAMQPYVALGAGFGWTDLVDLDELDRRLNFILQGGIGLRWNQRRGGAWTLEARISHLSNAGTVRPNLGLNAIVFLGGWRFP